MQYVKCCNQGVKEVGGVRSGHIAGQWWRLTDDSEDDIILRDTGRPSRSRVFAVGSIDALVQTPACGRGAGRLSQSNVEDKTLQTCKDETW